MRGGIYCWSYSGLPQTSIRESCAWLVGRYILKTDDDTFVHVPALVDDLEPLPTSSMVLGRFLKGMPGFSKDSNGKKQPVEDNYQRLPTFPSYPSGAGYVITRDVAAMMGHPPLPLYVHSSYSYRVRWWL